jgi:cell division protein ZapA (FtsZ GTPase activity inhibitor)
VCRPCHVDRRVAELSGCRKQVVHAWRLVMLAALDVAADQMTVDETPGKRRSETIQQDEDPRDH